MEFVTSIHCMDGRIQELIIRFIKEKFNATYVDVITEPGPCKILPQGSNHPLFESICQRVSISTEKHGSDKIFISGHYDCAGNLACESAQIQQLTVGEKMLQERFPNVEIIKLWVDQNWEVRIV